ncbi:MAG: hypothetical protein KAI02_00205 [Gammaproteobacteria bacterium]|nr:hypothetical protein [Gammaproteobacteria bacterium]
MGIIKRFQFFLYPFIVHLSIIFNLTYWVSILLPLLFYLLFSPIVSAECLRTKKLIICVNFKVCILCVLIFLAILSVLFKNYSLLYIPPIVISLLILFPFARSLSPDYIPLITQFYYLTEENTIESKRVRYTTYLTIIWVVLMSLMLLEVIVLSLFAPLEIWSLFTNFINYLILCVFMVIEWLFRAVYFKQWTSPVIFIKQLILIDQSKLLMKRKCQKQEQVFFYGH